MKIQDLEYLLVYLISFSASVILYMQDNSVYNAVILASVFFSILVLIMLSIPSIMGQKREQQIETKVVLNFLLYWQILIFCSFLVKTIFNFPGDLLFLIKVTFLLSLGVFLTIKKNSEARDILFKFSIGPQIIAVISFLLPKAKSSFEPCFLACKRLAFRRPRRSSFQYSSNSYSEIASALLARRRTPIDHQKNNMSIFGLQRRHSQNIPEMTSEKAISIHMTLLTSIWFIAINPKVKAYKS